MIFSSLYKNQSGNILIMFGLSAFLLMVALSIGIETARYSVARTKMQFALDLAVLSAASVRESQDSNQVANDFFKLNYPEEFMQTIFESGSETDPVVVNWDEANRVLSGYVRGNTKTFLGAFVGIDRLGIDNYAEVIEGTESRTTEIALVVDNSASMCKTSSLFGNGDPDPICAKLQAVKSATTGFVNNIFEDDPSGLYVGIVPFNHNVRMPSRHPLTGPVGPTNNAIWIHPNMPPHLASVPPPPLQNVLTQTNNRATLLNYLSAMNVTVGSWGFTRTNVGTLAAGLMLMPYPEDTAHFNHQAGMPSEFNERSDKILVLLTDGENIPHFTNANRRSTRVAVRSDVDNAHQLEVCNSLKQNYGVTIYAVTYDLPGTVESNDIKKIFHDCATGSETYNGSAESQTPYYFDAQSTQDLEITYQVIAESIKSVRLYK